MPKDKKTEEVRARVEDALARKFERFCKQRGWTESHTVREAIKELMAKADREAA